MKDIIKNFPPSWFACTMGTGILANVSKMYSDNLPILANVGVFLHWLNLGVFFFLLILWILRWILYPENALKDLKDPVIGNFYPTIGIGMLVISSSSLIIVHNLTLSWTFWIIGTILTLFFSFLIPIFTFVGEHVQISHLNPAWFIPPVGLIVIPIAGGVLLQSTTGPLFQLLLALNLFSWGAGFFLYISLHAIMFYRFILHKPLPSGLAPTIWINLGPVGAGTLSLLSLTKVLLPDAFKVSLLFGGILWGLGFWWLIVGLTMIIIYIAKRQFVFAMSWWAFTFPLGAYIASSYTLAKSLSLTPLHHIGFALYWLLLTIWVITFLKSFHMNFIRPLRKENK